MPGRLFLLRPIAAFAAFTTAFAADAQTSSLRERGRTLYVQGTHADGRPLTAVAGGSGMSLPPAFVACVNCHGYEARGKTEGGVTPSDIRWDTLAKPYELAPGGGRRHAPYDEALFLAAVTQGRDPSGHSLDPTMPRYQLSAAEASDLLAYLKQIGNNAGQGVTNDVIRIGFAPPDNPALGAQAEADRLFLGALFDDLNRQGGVFRRRIELTNLGSGAENFAPPVLAVLVDDDADARVRSSCETRRVPFLAVTARADGERSRYGFALYPGCAERVRALARYAVARDRSPNPQLAVIYSAERTPRALVESAVTAARPLAAVKPISLKAKKTDEVVEVLRGAGIGSALLLPGVENDFKQLLASAERRAWDPLFLWTEAVDHHAAGCRAVCVQSAPPADLSTETLANYKRWIGKAPVAEGDRARRFGLLASANVLTTALENAGREVGRERLVETLESMRDLPDGFTRSRGFSPRRHTAASGVYVVPLLASRYRPDPEWVPID